MGGKGISHPVGRKELIGITHSGYSASAEVAHIAGFCIGSEPGARSGMQAKRKRHIHGDMPFLDWFLEKTRN
ncbi:hypothetical protein TH19_17360 [Thalassospira profundimaris]|uniref:Uncharacterized protein n=1 Tax=Thalassospira profundimaris TaxID=502049 RepID=A0A367W1L9_9PROT|nr:hypothetical protein TH19_17360 [Thalassospira profundimaris]